MDSGAVLAVTVLALLALFVFARWLVVSWSSRASSSLMLGDLIGENEDHPGRICDPANGRSRIDPAHPTWHDYRLIRAQTRGGGHTVFCECVRCGDRFVKAGSIPSRWSQP